MTKESQSKNLEQFRLKAVLDVGSTSIRMAIAQISSDGEIKLLDSLNQSVTIGSDTFTRGKIGRKTIESCVDALRSFMVVLSEYGIDSQRDMRAVATSAVREASNRNDFLDRIFVATHIMIEVIEGTEVNYLKYLSLLSLLEKNSFLKEGHLLVAEVGGGNSELIGLESGRVSFAHSYRMGAYRLRERMYALKSSEHRQLNMLDIEIESNVRKMYETIAEESRRPMMLLTGGDARLAVQLLNVEWSSGGLAELKLNMLKELAQFVLKKDFDQLSKKYQLTFEDSQTLGPALQAFVRLAKMLQVKKVYVCANTLRDGLLLDAAIGKAWPEDFVQQIIYSARTLGEHYGLNLTHSEVVAQYSKRLYHALKEEHQLGHREEVYLTVAAMLHDIGQFIATSSHHKHSQYIIEHSELFGFTQQEIKLVALVARYHRRALPKSTHADNKNLSREHRLVVAKLAAILRIADALDRSRKPVGRTMDISLNKDALIVEVEQSENISAERQVLADKSDLFEKIYGRSVILRSKPKKR